MTISRETAITLEMLERASKKAASKNNVATGIDGVTAEVFEGNEEIQRLYEEIQSQQYQPLPVQQIDINKNEKVRKIGIYTYRDRVVQYALLEILEQHFNKILLPCSHAYRAGKSAVKAAEELESHIERGLHWVLETDIADFFDSIDHELMMEEIGNIIDNPLFLNLIRGFLENKIMHQMKLEKNEMGACQGSILSPILSNIYMHPFDEEIYQMTSAYIRYSDDLVIAVTSKKEAESLLPVVENAISNRRLRLNYKKTRISHVRDGFQFLGFQFDINGKGPSIKAIQALNYNLLQAEKKEFENMEAKLESMEQIIVGWQNYYQDISWVEPENEMLYAALVKNASGKRDDSSLKRLTEIQNKVNFTDPTILLELSERFYQSEMDVEAVLNVGRCLLLDESYHNSAANQLERILRTGDENQLKEATEIVRQMALLPEKQDNYFEMAELLTRCRQYALAKNFYEKGVDVKEGNESRQESDQISRRIYLHPQTIEKMLQLFSGNDEYFYREPIMDIFRESERVYGAVTQVVLEEHLKGLYSISVVPLKRNHTTTFALIDIDIAKKHLIETDGDIENKKKLLDKARNDANRIISAARGFGIPVYLEDSGNKGYHIWIFFEQPLKASKAKVILGMILIRAGEETDGIKWEIIPGSEHYSEDQFQQRIKLPLGKHPETGKTSYFLNRPEDAVLDQDYMINKIEPVLQEKIETVLSLKQERKTVNIDRKQITDSYFRSNQDDPLNITGKLSAKVLENCAVVRYIAEKSYKTKYLVHYERMLILQVFGCLGKEEVGSVHEIIRHCMNYRPTVTQRFIDKRLSKPISCNRIREKFPHLTAELGCNCFFKLNKNQYASPVLHVATSKKGVENKKNEEEGPLIMPIVEEEKNEVRDMKSLDEAKKAEELIEKMKELRKQQRGIAKSIKRCEQQLEDIIRKSGTKQIETEKGLLRKIQENGENKWVIEL